MASFHSYLSFLDFDSKHFSLEGNTLPMRKGLTGTRLKGMTFELVITSRIQMAMVCVLPSPEGRAA